MSNLECSHCAERHYADEAARNWDRRQSARIAALEAAVEEYKETARTLAKECERVARAMARVNTGDGERWIGYVYTGIPELIDAARSGT